MEVRVIAMFAMVVENIVMIVILQELVSHAKVIPNARSVKETLVIHVNIVRVTKSVPIVKETGSVVIVEALEGRCMIMVVSGLIIHVRVVEVLANVGIVQEAVIAISVPAAVSGNVALVMVLASVHYVQEVVSVKPVEEMLIAQHARIAMVSVPIVKEEAMCG